MFIAPAYLSVEEAADALVGDDLAAPLQGQASGRLLRRPAPLQAGQDLFPQVGAALQAGSPPAAGAGLLPGAGGV